MTVDFKINQVRAGHVVGDGSDNLGKLIIYTSRTSGSNLYSGTISDSGFAAESAAADVGIAVTGSKFAVGVPVSGAAVNAGVVLFTGDVVVSGALVVHSRITGAFQALSSSLIGVRNFGGSGFQFLSNSFFAASRNISVFDYNKAPADFQGYNVVLGSFGVEITNSNHVTVLNALSTFGDNTQRMVVTNSNVLTLIGTNNESVDNVDNGTIINSFGGSHSNNTYYFSANSFGTVATGNTLGAFLSNYNSTITNQFISILGQNQSTTFDMGTGSFVFANNGSTITRTDRLFSFNDDETQCVDVYDSTAFHNADLSLRNSNNSHLIGTIGVQVTNSGRLVVINDTTSSFTNSFQAYSIGSSRSWVNNVQNSFFLRSSRGKFSSSYNLIDLLSEDTTITKSFNVGVYQGTVVEITDSHKVMLFGDDATFYSNDTNIFSALNQSGQVLGATNSLSPSLFDAPSFYLGNVDVNSLNSSDVYVFGTQTFGLRRSDKVYVFGGQNAHIYDSTEVTHFGSANLIDFATRSLVLGYGITLNTAANKIVMGGGNTTYPFTFAVSASDGIDFATGSANFNEGISYKPRILTGSYNSTNRDHVMGMTAAAATTVRLPTSPVTGQKVVVKDIGGNATTFNITISSSNGLIDGASTYILGLNYASATIMFFTNAAGQNIWGVI